MVIVCLECGKPAKHIRYTQFSGNHPYCEEHAKLEKDFGQFNTTKFWSEVIEVENDESK